MRSSVFSSHCDKSVQTQKIMRTSTEAFTMLLFCSSLLLTTTISTAIETISTTQSIRDGETLVSAARIFELGFFSQGTSEKRYLGIWYKNISVMTVVWVANRESPLTDSRGVLKVNDTGILVLLNHNESIIWSSNSSRFPQKPVAKLLDSGNLIVQDASDHEPEDYLWQSFDYPSDTFLPGMKLGRNRITGMDRYMSSWKTLDDPSPGNYTCRVDFDGLVIRKGSIVEFRTGPWNGLRFGGIPHGNPNHIYTYQFHLDEDEIYYSFELLDSSIPSRAVVNSSGNWQHFTWVNQTQSWVLFLTLAIDKCDQYGLCGPHGSCNNISSPVCGCLKGFVPKFPDEWNMVDWRNGCVRKTPLNCAEDGFLKYSAVKLPDTRKTWYRKTMNLKECGMECKKNCSCTAYTNLDNREEGSGCLLWFDDLIDITHITEYGDVIYVRMAASELEGHSIKKLKAGIIVSSVTLVTGVLILGLVLYIRKKKLRNKGIRQKVNGMDYINGDGKVDSLELPIFDLTTIANATDNFSTSNKLGQGGFGPVYKGTLIEGQEIAVKRLSINSRQGLKEFKNEVILIAKLQHRNLVKLLGCCVHGEEKMLIYEFMPNKSLDFFIFDQARRELLNWSKRIHIIGGIARGLLYLHQDSRLTIIHRDLKAGNVLLDKDMNPKISDFGLAKTFGLNQTLANTNRVVGTYGYMAPEYMTDGLISVKSDVFSFGVLVLEIVSGNKNRGFCHPDHQLNLLGHAWKLWIEERPLELVDKSLGESCALSEIVRYIHVGLLCVQQKSENRPNMSSVVLMLGSEGLLPQPKQPGFYTERSGLEANCSTSSYGPCSENKITLTSLEAR